MTNRMGRINPAQDFLDPIAAYFSELLETDPLALVNHTFFLPTRRAARAFLSKLALHAPHDAVVMPRVVALSERPLVDLESEPLLLASNTERRLLMYSLLRQDAYKDQALLCTSERQFFQFVDAVLLVLDELILYEVSLDRFARLLPLELAAHQTEALKLLQQIYAVWFSYLKEQGYQDPTEARVLSYRAYTRQLQDHPYPVISVGIQAQYGFVVDFLKELHTFPQGQVYYVGTRCSPMTQDADVDRGHPQGHLLQLFKKMGVTFEDVPYLESDHITPFESFLSRLFDNHHVSDTQHVNQTPPVDTSIQHLHCIETHNLFEEAEVIALLMAESALTLDKTVALITSNQSLASMVTALLKRWSIVPDQSMSDSFKNSSLGRLLLLSAEFLVGSFSPTLFLSLLKHPYVSLGVGRLAVLSSVRLLENDVMRTSRVIRNESDLLLKTLPDSVRASLVSLIAQKQETQRRMKENPNISFADLIKELKAFLLHLVEGTQLGSYGSIFKTPEGQSFEAWLLGIEQSTVHKTRLNYTYWPEILRVFLADLPTATAWGKHPRVFILGPLEARLLSFDRVILPDFNEGRWPRSSSPSVWLGDRMKESLGMDGDRVSMSQQADDFLTFVLQKEVFITRARRVDGNPTIPSRWLMRLQAQLVRENKTLPSRDHYHEWAKQLWHQGEKVQSLITRPAANPPLNARPRRLTLSAIKRLKDNPYGFYLSDVLRLRPLNPLMHQLDAPRFGALLHAVLADDLLSRDSASAPSGSFLEQVTSRVFFAYIEHPLWRFYWKNRVEEALEFYCTLDAQLSQRADQSIAEIKVSTTLTLPFGSFELIAKADRIDVMSDRATRIIDYKTGKCPTLLEISRCDDVQLALEGLMIQNGALNTYDVMDTSALQYWDLKAGKCVNIPDVASCIKSAKDDLDALLEHYYEAGMAYDLVLKNLYEDVRHFSRWDEWAQHQMNLQGRLGASS